MSAIVLSAPRVQNRAEMARKATQRPSTSKVRNAPANVRAPRPNRIYELTKARKWTYAEVAARVRELAETIGDEDRLRVHEITINRLATGSMALTQDWMTTLGLVYAVDASEIITAPATEGLRRIKVMGALQAGSWAESHEFAIDDQHEIMIPDDPALRNVALYAGELRGESMNRRYPNGAIIIMSRVTQRPGEIAEGKRYHVRMTHADGLTEETIKTLTKDAAGDYWLKPESDHPEFQEWISLDGKPGTTVELIGRVRGVYHRED